MVAENAVNEREMRSCNYRRRGPCKNCSKEDILLDGCTLTTCAGKSA
jgi:hypothetical protein